MKKFIMSLSLALAAIVAVPSVAFAQDNSTVTKQEQCRNKKDCKKGKKGDKKSRDGKGKCCKDSVSMRIIGEKGPKGNPLMKGITLTADQEQKMTALMNQRRAEKAKMKEAQKQDKAAMKEKYQSELKKNQESLDKEVQKILNADQMKQYEANKAQMQQMKAAKGQKHAKGMKNGKDRKDGKGMRGRKVENATASL